MKTKEYIKLHYFRLDHVVKEAKNEGERIYYSTYRKTLYWCLSHNKTEIIEYYQRQVGDFASITAMKAWKGKTLTLEESARFSGQIGAFRDVLELGIS